ncbi:3-hydroxyisobutyrate dehydrogenase [Stella humosa]|uniref:3-hydroxyisobutyrate dehydrogenase n=1 Tax=Stella humosa TaxID=94 RepID=A0A3N1LI74_9PROT|nr:NAD(P)-dependent oxidoreductase [Stella humosa]ROP90539.1 3-hydroxyisobutyrate dehydrogenase [Stella humosa]
MVANQAEQVGFVGLGMMGEPMVKRLLGAGHRVALADADPARLAVFAGEAAASRPPTLAAMGEACPVVITMLPNGRIVEDVVFGRDGANDGLVAGLAAGSVVVDMSSSSPVGTRALGQRLAERGIRLVDAPVSGGVKRAVDGSLAIMAGGDAADVDRLRPIFAALGRQVFHTGPVGTGHAMKALNNYLSAAGLLAAGEAMLIGQKFGLAAETMVDVWNASTGRNNATEVKFKPFIIPKTWAAGFSMGLMVKDLRTALEVAEATGEPADFARLCTEIWAAAEAKVGPGADHTEIVRYLDEMDGD